MTSKAVKLDDAVYARLKVLAEARRRTPHWLMKEAIGQFLDREEEAERVRRETMERWARFEAGGETVAHETVEGWLKAWGTKDATSPFLRAEARRQSALASRSADEALALDFIESVLDTDEPR
jgi:predicted transcriptional regulator